jgi:hypothetical protein
LVSVLGFLSLLEREQAASGLRPDDRSADKPEDTAIDRSEMSPSEPPSSP